MGTKELSYGVSFMRHLHNSRKTYSIYTNVEPIINWLLPLEQEGFCHGRITADQVTLVKQDIENSFTAKKKARAVFVDPTTIYDTV